MLRKTLNGLRLRWHGLRMQGPSLQKLAILVMLFGIPLMIFIYLRRKNSMNKGLEIYSLVKMFGLTDTLAKFAAAQAAHETGGYTSSIFLNNNNAFGMKYAGQVNATGEKNGYAYYPNINASVADFCAWWIRKRSNPLSFPLIVTSIESYVKFLKNNNYFEATEAAYLKGCKYYYNLLF